MGEWFFRWRPAFPNTRTPNPFPDGRAFATGSHYNGKDPTFAPATRQQVYHGRPWLCRAHVYHVRQNLVTRTTLKLLSLQEYVSDTERWILGWKRPTFRNCFREVFEERDGVEGWFAVEWVDDVWPFNQIRFALEEPASDPGIGPEQLKKFRLGSYGYWNDSQEITQTWCNAYNTFPPFQLNGWGRFSCITWFQNGCLAGSDALPQIEDVGSVDVPPSPDETERSEIIAELSARGYLFDAGTLFLEDPFAA